MDLQIKKTFLSDEILKAAPKNEPDRQHYFIDRLNALFTADGTEKKACVATFGCQMNARDSEKLTGILSEIGFEEGDSEEKADFVIFNTCTVRENANEHLYGRLGRLKQSKKANPDMIIGVCGCMMQETDEVAKLRAKYPYVDIIFGTHNLYTFPELLFTLLRKREGFVDAVSSEGSEVIASSADDIIKYERLQRYGSKSRDMEKLYRKPVVSVWKDNKDIVEELPSKRKYSFKQGINIMFGCNNFCSYCIVPYVRGREKSRKPEDIYEEIRRAADDGVKEIMLLGQNVNSYDGGIRFPELLRNVDDIACETGIERVRFMTSHPKDLSDELIEAMAASKKVCRQFHLPMQSGSDAVLKRMNRHYDKETFLKRAEGLKKAMPDISLSTDIIVGFPGETEGDFLETLDVVKRVRFDAAYTFIYSKREGTPAAAYTDQIDEETVKNRFNRLLDAQNAIVAENLAKYTGRILPVLFEDMSEYDKKLISGKLEGGTTVHVPGDASAIGSLRKVLIKECRGFYFIGEIVD